MTFRTGRFGGSLRRFFTVGALGLVVVMGQGCKQEQATPLPEKPVAFDPLPIPADLVANVYIPNPDIAWSRMRLAVGGPAMFLPVATGGLAATLFGFPITIGSEIDGNVPVVAAVLEGRDGGKPRMALGLHLRSPDKFIQLATQGEAARHVMRVDEKTKMTLIEPKGGGAGSVALGVLGNYLVAAPTAEDLADVGPYVVRNLTTAKMPTNDITVDMPRTALEGPVAKTLRSKWDSIKPRPRANSPAATLPSPVQTLVDGVLAVIAELDRGKMTLDFDQQNVHVRFQGTPKTPLAQGSRIASMTVGDPKKLLELPGTTDVAFYVHDSVDVRTNDAQGYASALATTVGKDVTDEDRAAMEKALTGLAKSRGDAFVGGFAMLPAGPAAFARSSGSDPDGLLHAIDDLLAVTERKPVARWLGELELGVKGGKMVVEDVKGDVRRIHLERLQANAGADKPAPKGGAKAGEAPKKDNAKADEAAAKGPVSPTTMDVLYLMGGDELVLGAGYDAKAVLRMTLDASSKDNLSMREDMKAAMKSMGDKAAFVVIADLIRLLARQTGTTPTGPAAPLVFALGKGGDGLGADEPWMRLDVANSVIQELVKHRGAF
ncbi:MAG TPA: hypothetical protein PK156_35085 [Polyangium sp.]|nr:hypothetical protein [Polyangium sp.]